MHFIGNGVASKMAILGENWSVPTFKKCNLVQHTYFDPIFNF